MINNFIHHNYRKAIIVFMSLTTKIKSEWKWILGFFLVSIVFVTIFSFTTSPLYNYFGCDQEIFRMLGRMTKKGFIPYKEFFDHKGPVTITFQWIGCLISEKRIGILTVQAFCVFFSLCLAYKLFLLKYSKKLSLVLTAVILLTLRFFYGGGNSVEEFCLPFLLLSSYCFCKFCIKDKKDSLEHSVKYSVIYGITIAVCMYTRLTNVFPVLAILLVGVFYLIKNKLWKNLLFNALGTIGGIVIISLPYFIYFYIHGAIYDMLFATFIYNIRHGSDYSQAESTSELIKIIIYMFILVCTMLMGIYSIRKKKNELIGYSVVIMSIMGMFMHMKMRFYLHYYIIYIPIIIMGLLCVEGIYKDFKNKQLTIISRVTLMALVFMMAFTGVKTIISTGDILGVIKDKEIMEQKNNDMLDIVNDIDKNEDIISYLAPPQFYIITDTYPCYRNFILQDQQTRYDAELREGFEKDLKSLNAKYIVAPKYLKGRYIPFIKQHYSINKENKRFILFERK